MKTLYILLFLLLSLNAKSQENVHWLINQDETTNCNYIKTGKFVHEKTHNEITEGYTIEFRGDYVLENMEDGKYFVKSKITYTSACSYEITVIETNAPYYKDQIGKTFYTEILETAKLDQLVKIRLKGAEWTTIVLKKIEE